MLVFANLTIFLLKEPSSGRFKDLSAERFLDLQIMASFRRI
jgi:hypothetical protein